MKKILATLIISSFLFSGCVPNPVESTNQRFGDQHFKTVVSLIEMHKVRTGSYPNSLSELNYVGSWDTIALSSVKYEKVEDGYNLDLVNGWIGKPQDLEFDQGFWQGLGLVNSNMK